MLAVHERGVSVGPAFVRRLYEFIQQHRRVCAMLCL